MPDNRLGFVSRRPSGAGGVGHGQGSPRGWCSWRPGGGGTDGLAVPQRMPLVAAARPPRRPSGPLAGDHRGDVGAGGRGQATPRRGVRGGLAALIVAHPLKRATPTRPPQCSSRRSAVAPPGLVEVKVTEPVSLVTVLPAPSCTVTTGWVASAMPLVVAGLGEVVNASLAAVRWDGDGGCGPSPCGSACRSRSRSGVAVRVVAGARSGRSGMLMGESAGPAAGG